MDRNQRLARDVLDSDQADPKGREHIIVQSVSGVCYSWIITAHVSLPLSYNILANCDRDKRLRWLSLPFSSTTLTTIRLGRTTQSTSFRPIHVSLHRPSKHRELMVARAWLSLGCWNVAALGFPYFWSSLLFNSDVRVQSSYILCPS
jgi:hypothetical protein